MVNRCTFRVSSPTFAFVSFCNGRVAFHERVLIHLQQAWRKVQEELLLSPVCQRHHPLDFLYQWVEFYQMFMDTLVGQAKEQIRFWWLWSQFQGHRRTRLISASASAGRFLTPTSQLNWLNFTKLARMYHWNEFEAYWVLVTLILFSRLQEGLDTKFLYLPKLCFGGYTVLKLIRFLWPWSYFQGYRRV